ncbi:hypothetical protein JKP88DRAFT_247621 [Tribonema minus]|uniref:Uncharacterized protein n=1 Tax=Tribonema minus TaxID=303371 RepID=A0A836CBA7_9STRA|nr:hypothetical protein JKP88DRAFT_247621 [Tribonema minus]
MELGGPVPTFDDLSIDDNLSQLERVVKYSTSSIALQRLVHVKAMRSIVPLFEALSMDEEYVVRQVLAEQMEPIARVCMGAGGAAAAAGGVGGGGAGSPGSPTAPAHAQSGGGYRLIIETILPVLSRLLGDSKVEVRQSAGEALRGVAALMRPGDLGQYVLTIVLQLAHDDSNEELVSAAMC